MILQRSSPPWLETPFEVFDKGAFTPSERNEQTFMTCQFIDRARQH
jgi:hypothetical protein